MKCCMSFRDMFIEETSVDPFEHSLTIASACSKVFRKLFLQPKTIGIIPYNGYRGKDKQSATAIKWLQWLSKKEGLNIRHKLNGGEVKIGPFKVDGSCESTIYEFYGCYWHGCLQCLPDRNYLTPDKITTARSAFEKTQDRKKYLENKGYQIIEKWECQLHQELQEDQEMKTFFEKPAVYEPLNPRNGISFCFYDNLLHDNFLAFYGGRTNAVKLYHKIKKDNIGNPLQKIRYVDICSLYPYVNKYGSYPVGHPKLITENFKRISKSKRPYEGLIFCKVLPPKRLLHPVLPYRSCGKLTFPLCGKCADKRNQCKCLHNVDERALIGTWVTPELYKAVSLGYKVIFLVFSSNFDICFKRFSIHQVLKIMEVWHFDQVEVYDKDENPDGGLFSQYVNCFMKLKLVCKHFVCVY